MNKLIAFILTMSLPIGASARAGLDPECRAAYEHDIDIAYQNVHNAHLDGAFLALLAAGSYGLKWVSPGSALFTGSTGVLTYFLLGEIRKDPAHFAAQILASAQEAENGVPGEASKSLATYLTGALNPIHRNAFQTSHPYEITDAQQAEVLKRTGQDHVSAEHVMVATQTLLEKDALCTPDRQSLDKGRWFWMMVWTLGSPQPPAAS